ncbi:nuclear RNA export factor 2-like [Tenrec ecaudatus]|uniref:nuclear RNA export factor 2-like n=1 Tax=Tenrec ecaudatus TaxID=94439 RepID=UPI003F5A4550
MLDKVKEPVPEEMCAERKPLGTTFPDEPTNERSSLGKYFRGSGNMKKVKDPVPWTQLLKRTKGELVDFLRGLPPTQHDLNSFVVDMCVYSVSTYFLPEAGRESKERKKGRKFFRGNPDEDDSRYEPQPPYQQDDGQTVELRDVGEQLQGRHPPYTGQPNSRVGSSNKKHFRITVWVDRRFLKREEEKRRDGKSRSCFKITVPYGRKQDKTWLRNSIKNQCSASFTPHDFHYKQKQAEFLIQDASTGSGLKLIQCHLSDEEDQKISIIVNPSVLFHFIQNKLKPEQMELLKMLLDVGEDGSQGALDWDMAASDVVDHDSNLTPDARENLAAILKILAENFQQPLSLACGGNRPYQLSDLSDMLQEVPDVKAWSPSSNEIVSEGELGNMEELKIDEGRLEGDPLYDTCSDQAANISDILDSFSRSLCLDGEDLPPKPVPPPPPPSPSPRLLPSPPPAGAAAKAAVFTDPGIVETVKPCTDDTPGSAFLKDAVFEFLYKYYWIYDYHDRQDLLNVYHQEACFSLTTPFNPEDLAPNSLGEYFKCSRNMKTLEDPAHWFRWLKYTRHNIVDFLGTLPQTQHDLSSFMVDMCVHMEKMVCFSITGIFKQVDAACQARAYCFTRTFVALTNRDFRLCIVNDQLTVTEAKPKETWSTPAQAPAFSSTPTITQEQQDMVQAFSTWSGMALPWSLKCLEDNQWVYTVAKKAFMIFKVQGRIPEEAFQQSL